MVPSLLLPLLLLPPLQPSKQIDRKRELSGIPKRRLLESARAFVPSDAGCNPLQSHTHTRLYVTDLTDNNHLSLNTRTRGYVGLLDSRSPIVGLDRRAADRNLG